MILLNNIFTKALAALAWAPLSCLIAAADVQDVHCITGAWSGRTPLWQACFDGKPDEVRRLMAAGADPEKVYISRRGIASALMVAQSVEVARVLVEYGANVNFVGEEGKTPLMGSLLHRPDAVKYLLELGANPNARDHKGNTPLHHCTYNAESARLLIEAGADVNARNEAGDTPLMVQSGVGIGGEETGRSEPVVRLLLRHGADLNIRNKAGLNALDLAMTLLDSWYDSNPVLPLLQREGQTASLHAQLVGAAAAGKVEICKSLLKQGADPNALGPGAPNALAACMGSIFEPGEHTLELTELLLAAGANPNLAATSIACSCPYVRDREKILELLFRHGYDLAMVDIVVLRSVMSFEQQRHDGAVSEFLQMLLNHGAEPGDDASLAEKLRCAIESGNAPDIYYVQNCEFWMDTRLPGDIPAPFADGRNNNAPALVLAAALGRTEAVRILLAMKCDVSAPDSAGRTALEYAAAAGHTEPVRLLLQAGATRISQALQLAEQYGQKETAALLQNAAQ
ncbi:MAG: ankyrin repeat domain-containing protein [Akkermansia sp.]|nr:ankyrin repeat domain-containing protein [Akkermansia sp.]